MVSLGKFVQVRFASERKEAKLSGVGKVVERDPAWSWCFVSNSSFLNGDVGITGLVILNFGKQITASSSWFAFLIVL